MGLIWKTFKYVKTSTTSTSGNTTASAASTAGSKSDGGEEEEDDNEEEEEEVEIVERELHWIFSTLPKGASTSMKRAILDLDSKIQKRFIDTTTNENGLRLKIEVDGSVHPDNAVNLLNTAKTNWTNVTV